VSLGLYTAMRLADLLRYAGYPRLYFQVESVPAATSPAPGSHTRLAPDFSEVLEEQVGKPTDSPGVGLSECAFRALNYRFSPATCSGKPVTPGR